MKGLRQEKYIHLMGTGEFQFFLKGPKVAFATAAYLGKHHSCAVLHP